MKTYGIRISDGREVLRPTLKDILEAIDKDPCFQWCLLFVNGVPHREHGYFVTEFQKKVNDSENGLLISRPDLENFSGKYFQMYEILVIGSGNIDLLHRYTEDPEMYKTCDVVIELIDCAFWEVHVKDVKILERLKRKFEEIELLNPF